MSSSQTSSSSGATRAGRWMAPSKGGYSGLPSNGVKVVEKRTPPKSPASSTRSTSGKKES